MSEKSMGDVDNENKVKFPLVAENTVWSNDNEHEFLTRVSKALEAGAFINSQNMDYIVFDPIRGGQNSNSAAATIMHAMGVSYTPEVENLWAPGTHRILLPENFVSKVGGQDMTVPGTPMNSYIEKLFESLKLISVHLDVKSDKNPYKVGEDELYEEGDDVSGPTYFDPKNPASENIPASLDGNRPVVEQVAVAP